MCLFGKRDEVEHIQSRHREDRLDFPPLAHGSSFCRACAAIPVPSFLSFQRFPSGEPVALFSRVGVRQKENHNDAHGSIRDCLAESETTSA